MYKNVILPLLTRDYKETITFYCELIDFKIYKNTEYEGLRDVVLAHNYLPILLSLSLIKKNETRIICPHYLCFSVNDISIYKEKLNRNNILFDTQIPPYGEFIYFSDLSGNKIIISAIY